MAADGGCFAVYQIALTMETLARELGESRATPFRNLQYAPPLFLKFRVNVAQSFSLRGDQSEQDALRGSVPIDKPVLAGTQSLSMAMRTTRRKTFAVRSAVLLASDWTNDGSSGNWVGIARR